MIPLRLLAAAIALSAPSLPRAVAQDYARTIRHESAEHRIDPLLVVAVVENESRWEPNARNPESGCVGLGGICPGTFAECRQDPSGEPCGLVMTSLRDPTLNLRTTVALLGLNRDYCRSRFRSVRESDWLQGYQGTGQVCGRVGGKRGVVPGLTRKVMARRDELGRAVKGAGR